MTEPTPRNPMWITETDVTTSIDLIGAIDALERVLAAEGRGQAENMPKTHLMVGDNNALHALGGAVKSEGICGTKTWVNVDGKSSTLLVVYSLENGSCRAVIEATALGQIRTAAMTGLGTKWLAPENASEMAIIGTGKQALPQIAACLAVRPIKAVRIFSRSAEKRSALADAVTGEFPDLDIIVCDTLKSAVTDVPLITLCTNATEPFFSAEMAATGAHINAVGAIVPKRVEFTADVFPRCAVVAVDSLAGVKELSSEFIDYFGSGRAEGAGGAGLASWDQVQPISEIIANGQSRPPARPPARPPDADLTLFKAMGMGIADLAVAAEVLKHCETSKTVHSLPERQRQPLPLQSRARAAE